MFKFLWITIVICMYIKLGVAQSHGLQFSSHEVVPEKRTALNLTPTGPFCFAASTEISFDLKFRPHLETYFGYIVRIIGASPEKPGQNNSIRDKENIDLVYDQRLLNFNFVIGENSSNVFAIDSASLHGRWNNIRIRFDLNAQKVSLLVNGRQSAICTLKLGKELCLKILFGINDQEGFQTVDLPPMQIRNIRITENGILKHSFPLQETTGNRSTDSVTDSPGVVRNPVWISRKHQNWEQAAVFNTKGSASFAFDENNETLFILSRDSLYKLAARQMLLNAQPLTKPRSMLPPGNQSIFDNRSGRLINFYPDDKRVSVFDPATATFSVDFSPQLLTEFWQVNKFLSPVDTSLYVIGGYGQLHYKNRIARYHLANGRWDTINLQGDFFMPRYLAALGTNRAGDTAYILGGYGSNTGDQKVNPKHTYDLLAFSVRTGYMKKLQQLTEPASHFTFANNLVVDPETRRFYCLVYPRDRFRSSLRILEGSLDSANWRFLADTIPYEFHDIESYADLFYAPVSKKLIAVTSFTNKDSLSTVRVYSIDFPPNDPGIPASKKNTDTNTWLVIAAVAGFLILAGFIFRRKRDSTVPVAGKTAAEPAPVSPAQTETVAAPEPILPTLLTEPQMELINDHGSNFAAENLSRPSIFLFGQFHVTDVNGADITRQFTPLLKELFLLIVIHSALEQKGISSEALTEILWFSKSEKDAKNNRAVNIAKLKAIIEKLGTPVVSKISGVWELQMKDDSVYVDFVRFRELTRSTEPVNRSYIEKLLLIGRRGTFLSQTDYTWLDEIKSSVSNTVIDKFIEYLEKVNIPGDAEFVIDITNCIFQFDRLNEQALEYKCKSLIALKRHALANTTYLNFIREYKEIYQEEFPRQFNEVIR